MEGNMAKPFDELRERLLRGGVAPRHVRRYLSELGDHLADLTAEGECAGHNREDAESAALVRLGRMDDLASAMIAQRQYQSWCVRAPWAVLGLAPLFGLAGAWFIALFILWSGWTIFLPAADSPFIRIHGFAIFYFGVGRMIYFGAPLLIGWGVGLIAARQRLQTSWPVAGLVLIALMGGTAQVNASRTAVASGVGHISMGFALGSSVQGIAGSLVHALVILSLTVLPYLAWRLRSDRALSA
jgi:hypothetical protein